MKNEEIKEILDKLKKHLEHIKFADLTNYDLRLLLDYITDLQQVIENYVKITLHDRKEIERLKEENEKLTENNQAMQVEMARTWKIADDYKSKCLKAIEKISLLKMDDITIETNKALDYVLKSLNGSDEK